MRIKEIYCKTALSKSELPDIDYSLNPYRGCEHACLYCYVPNVLSIPRKEWGKFVEIRRNIPTILAKELKKKERGVIGLSTVTDPYQPVEKDYKLSRLCVEQIAKSDFPLDVQTKSDLIVRDIDVLKKVKEVVVGLTIPTLKDEERKILEPVAPPIDKRLKALEKLAREGIRNYVFFGPAYPSIELDEVKEIVECFVEHGANTIIVDDLHLKEGVWENIQRNLPRDLERVYRRRLFDERKRYYDRIFREVKKWCKEYDVGFERAF
ncbi:MAG: radical SAM protein [Thermoplasmata archaeon]|nr:MAG: radical SAM protein [Thermoplasmata archaeon]KAA0009630.1 MAG: radical SAM protein [Thermoplasmata archaeon]